MGNGWEAVDTLPPEGSLLFFSSLFGFEFILNCKCLDGEVDRRKDANEKKNTFFFSPPLHKTEVFRLNAPKQVLTHKPDSD